MAAAGLRTWAGSAVGLGRELSARIGPEPGAGWALAWGGLDPERVGGALGSCRMGARTGPAAEGGDEPSVRRSQPQSGTAATAGAPQPLAVSVMNERYQEYRRVYPALGQIAGRSEPRVDVSGSVRL